MQTLETLSGMPRGIDPNRQSVKMGDQLLDIIQNAPMHIHNDGSITYHSGENRFTPEITLSSGIVESKPISWKTIDDDLRTPHSGILIEIGSDTPFKEVTKVDWKSFPWDLYKEHSRQLLSTLIDDWTSSSATAEEANHQLTSGLHNLVAELGTTRRICTHSKPWIDKASSDQLKKLRQAKKKMRQRRSPANVRAFKDMQEETTQIINRAYQTWWESLSKQLLVLDGKEKWKTVNKLLEHSTVQQQVQPLRKTDIQGKCHYVFEDEEISNMLRDYHIGTEVKRAKESTRITSKHDSKSSAKQWFQNYEQQYLHRRGQNDFW